MHFHAAKLSVKQSPVIAQVGTNNLMKTTLPHDVIGMLRGMLTAKEKVSHTQFTHMYVIYMQLLKTLYA